MNRYGRTSLAGILIVAGALSACGGGSAQSAVADAAGTPSTPIISARGADLHSAATTASTLPSASNGAAVPAPAGTLKLSGTAAASIIAGQPYAFQPAAANAAAPLTFSIANKPAWATFSPATGKLSGTPTPGDVGTNPAILISASDGTATVSLAPFSLSVTATGAHNLVLTWAAPTDNADGTPLVDLTGYKIRYGTTAGNYTQSVTLANAGLNRYVVDNLGTGTYYFAISAYNRTGTESQLSGEVSTTFN